IQSGEELHTKDLILTSEPRFKVSFKPLPLACNVASSATMIHFVRKTLNGIQVTEARKLTFRSVSTPAQLGVDRIGQNDPSGEISSELSRGSFEIYYSSCWTPMAAQNFGHLNAEVVDRPVDLGVMNMEGVVSIHGKVSVAPSAKGLIEMTNPQWLFIALLD